MEGKLIDLDFIFVGFKFTGRFDEYPTLIPQAVKEVIEKNHEIGLVKIFIFCLIVWFWCACCSVWIMSWAVMK